MADLRTEVDKLDVEKLAPVPVDLSKLYDVVNNDVVKKTVYDKLVTEVNKIDTNGFVWKTKCNIDRTKCYSDLHHILMKKRSYVSFVGSMQETYQKK